MIITAYNNKTYKPKNRKPDVNDLLQVNLIALAIDTKNIYKLQCNINKKY